MIRVRFFLILTFCVFHTIAQKQAKFELKWLQAPKLYSEHFEHAFELIECSSYQPQDSQRVFFEFGYANFNIKELVNQQNFDALLVDTIKLVFSKYPKSQKYWITNYYDLISLRLKSLFRAYPTLNRQNIHWQIVLQDSCKTEADAIALFHGFVLSPKKMLDIEKRKVQFKDSVYTVPVVDSSFIESITLDSVKFTFDYQEVVRFVEDLEEKQDSTVMKVLDRNKTWFNSTVVLDWTGSMYHHGASSVLWHLLNLEHTTISNFVFFNDGNKKAKHQKKLGKVGGIYYANAEDIQRVIRLFRRVQRAGNGGDKAENDVEALIKSIRKFKDADNIVLVADNYSCIRDFELIKKIKKPIHIILPGLHHFINHQYINMAYLTKGSLHTFDKDYLDFSKDKVPNQLTIEGCNYFLNSSGFYQTKDPEFHRFCNNYYGIKRYQKKVKSAIPFE